MKRAQIEVPATSANLGPGFDCLGLALNIVDTVTVEPAPDVIKSYLHGAEDLGIDRHRNLICRAYNAWSTDTGMALPAVRFQLDSRIPIGKGLGSSAASIVAGLAAARFVANEKDGLARMLRLASRLEGHPDNTSAALLGGLTVALIDGEDVQAMNAASHFSFGIALFVPLEGLRTTAARSALPETVPHGDAAFNVARVAYLLTSLMWGRWEVVGTGMEDRLHQPYRAKLIPALPELIAAAKENGAYGAALSGGGPSVIAFGPPERAEEFGLAMERSAGQQGWPGSSMVTSVRHLGVQVRALS
jgi:homoserine kinase